MFKTSGISRNIVLLLLCISHSFQTEKRRSNAHLPNGRSRPPPLFPIYLYALLFDTTPRSAWATYQTDRKLWSSLGFHHPGSARAALWNLISTTQKYHYRLHRSWQRSRASWEIFAHHIVPYEARARCAANVSDNVGYEIIKVRWLVCPSKPALEVDFDRKTRLKPAGRSAERDALLSMRADVLGCKPKGQYTCYELGFKPAA